MPTSCYITGENIKNLGFDMTDSSPEYIEFKKKIADKIYSLTQRGLYNYYCDCTLGASLIAAETIIEFKNTISQIKLFPVIPYKGIEKEWSEDAKKRFRIVLEKSCEYIFFQDKFTHDCKKRCHIYLSFLTELTVYADSNSIIETVNYYSPF